MTAGFTWQALNALAFFFKYVCGVEEPVFQVKLKDLTTTEIYLHVATGANGLGVVSPLDVAA